MLNSPPVRSTRFERQERPVRDIPMPPKRKRKRGGWRQRQAQDTDDESDAGSDKSSALANLL
eukprot:4448914-Pyramimonas_sp.AAC.1